MLRLLYILIQLIQPILVPVCFVLAWGLVFCCFWTVWSAIRDTAARTKQMHQIPCSECRYFTNDYRLKCTVCPTIANTENAIDCSQFSPNYSYSPQS